MNSGDHNMDTGRRVGYGRTAGGSVRALVWIVSWLLLDSIHRSTAQTAGIQKVTECKAHYFDLTLCHAPGTVARIQRARYGAYPSHQWCPDCCPDTSHDCFADVTAAYDNVIKTKCNGRRTCDSLQAEVPSGILGTCGRADYVSIYYTCVPGPISTPTAATTTTTQSVATETNFDGDLHVTRCAADRFESTLCSDPGTAIQVVSASYGDYPSHLWCPTCCPNSGDCLADIHQVNRTYYREILDRCNGKQRCEGLPVRVPRGLAGSCGRADYVTIHYTCPRHVITMTTTVPAPTPRPVVTTTTTITTAQTPPPRPVVTTTTTITTAHTPTPRPVVSTTRTRPRTTTTNRRTTKTTGHTTKVLLATTTKPTIPPTTRRANEGKSTAKPDPKVGMANATSSQRRSWSSGGLGTGIGIGVVILICFVVIGVLIMLIRRKSKGKLEMDESLRVTYNNNPGEQVGHVNQYTCQDRLDSADTYLPPSGGGPVCSSIYDDTAPFVNPAENVYDDIPVKNRGAPDAAVAGGGAGPRAATANRGPQAGGCAGTDGGCSGALDSQPWGYSQDPTAGHPNTFANQYSTNSNDYRY